MSEENTTQEQQAGAQTEQAAQQTQFALQRIYIKDLSFESPKSPEIFREQLQPDIDLNVSTNHRLLDGDFYEVVLGVTVTAKNEEGVAFIAEVQQAGIFLISGFDDSSLVHALGAYCPGLLFPYAREALDGIVVKGTFPALMLAPVNFEALFAQEMERQREQAGSLN